MTKIVLAALLALTLPSTGLAQTSVWTANGHTYEFRVRPLGIDWSTAQAECSADGGYLATVTSDEENDFIFALIEAGFQDSVWLGGLQPPASPEPAGNWQWVTGEAFTYPGWESGEPNNGFGALQEDAIAYYQSPGQPVLDSWNDVPASTAISAYIFESNGPMPYCTAGTSASGCQATLGSSGVPSASAGSGFHLSASGVEGDKSGLFFFGTGGRQANPWGNGTSFQCVAPPVKRGGLLAKGGTAGSCDGSYQQDLNALWSSSPSKNPGAGALVQAQLWYRDPQNTSNQPTSLSNALEFAVAP